MCLVSIRCLVYNHEPYLRRCLDGFVMQKTNFRFEAIVHDDASTDGSAAIIREYAEKYPDVIKPIYETENQYSKRDGSLSRIMDEACKGKYIAMCEGDDYWTDPLKLQKQVDFLESHPDYGLVHGDVKYYIYEKGVFKGRIGLIFSKYNSNANIDDKKNMFYDIMFGRYSISTLTVMYRKDIFDSIEKLKTFRMGDTPLWLDFSQKSKIGYIDDVFGVYVKHQGSATRQNKLGRLLFEISACDMRVYYCKKYGYEIPEKLKYRYNKALIDLKINNISNEASYTSFDINRFYRILIYVYSKNGLLRKCLKMFDVIKIQFVILIRLIDNFFWKLQK